MSNLRSMHCFFIAAAILLFTSLTGCGGAAVSDTAATPAPAPEKSIEATLPREKIIPVEERDPNRLWCREHNVYEDECLICHPELANKTAPREPSKAVPEASSEARDPKRLWCKEHDTYEDECLICHPELKDKKVSQNSADPGAGLMCNEHHVPEKECGICRPDRLANLDVGQGLKIRFASNVSADKAGVATGMPVSTSAGGSVSEILGEIAFNRDKVAKVTPLAAGSVVEVYKEVGAIVEAGDVLALVQSAEVAEARSSYLKALAESALARQQLAREKDLHQRQISARQDLEEAQAAVAVNDSEIDAARQRLLNLGLSKADLAETEKQKSSTSLLTVRAPFAGTVIERNAVQGTAASPGEALFQVADLSTMWLELSVPENQLMSLRVGSTIQARFEAYPGLLFEGTLEWISPGIDSETRMIRIRAVLPNPQGMLKDGLFGTASFGSISDAPGITVPSDAVQNVDGKRVIFKKLEDDLYESRVVELGASGSGGVVVLAGLALQDEIVTKGSYVVKSELLKMRMGAGCTDE